MHKIITIILNWNSPKDAQACADSILSQSVKSDILFIDNNSSDDSVNQFIDYKNRHPKENIFIIQNNKNFGFAGGINIGLRHSIKYKYDATVLLNPDATADKDWIKHLSSELYTDKTCGIATGVMLKNNKKTIDSTGDLYTTWGLPGPRNRDETLDKIPKTPHEVFGATGGGVIYRNSMLQEIGLLDEVFFMYYEDVDISFRAQLSGWKVRFTPKAIAYHKVGASSQKVPGLTTYNTFKNLPLLFIKNVPGRLFFSIGSRFFFVYWLLVCSSILKGRGVPALKGVLASLYRTPYAYKQRWLIQKNRKVSTNYIRDIIHKGPLQNQHKLVKIKNFFVK